GSHSYPYGEDVNQKTYIEYYINGAVNGDGTINSDPNFNGTCMKIPEDSAYGTYAPGNYAFFISYADLNNLVPGQNFVFADYGDTLYQIEKSTDEYASVMEEFNMVNDDVYITPTSVKWSTLSGMAYFTVKPDILNSDSANCTSVYIDGECVPKQYWTYDKDTHSLGFKTEYLKQLPKEAHTLEVITSNGKVGATIETNVGLAPKNLDYHVYGGAKSLSFVASDKINKEGGIWIGSSNPVKLDPSCYVWDSDTGFTLSSAFLNRLNLGTYYISAYVWDGSQYVYRTTSFKVISASQASYNPSTGDSSKIFIWVIVLVLSAVAIVVILLPRFKKGDGKEDTKAAGKKQKK
ncbi:MAG: hypothetical protein Q4F31_10400, partial [Eubacteriales bacterium]|nr:hypothetical protein [Eubacteriales bacterium]